MNKIISFFKKIPLEALVLLLPISVFAIHFKGMWPYLIDFPFADEWEMIGRDNLPWNFSWDWMFKRHGDHVIVPTRILIWSLLRFDGWNLITNQIINFALFGVLLGVLHGLCKIRCNTVPAWVSAAFLVYQLNGLAFENHSWGFQSQFHFFILFFFLALYFLFEQAQSNRALFLGVTMGILSMISFSAGAACIAAALVVFGIFKLVRCKAFPKKTELTQLAVVGSVLTGALIFWSEKQDKVGSMSDYLVLPHRLQFWQFFLRFPSFGFGFLESTSLWLGIGCSAIAVVPMLICFFKKDLRQDSGFWMAAAGALGAFGALAGVSIGRAYWMEPGKPFRYAEIATLIIPFSAMLWWYALANVRYLRTAAMFALWGFCYYGFENDWRFADFYKGKNEVRWVGLAQAEDYFMNGGDGTNILHYSKLASTFEHARELNMSFYRTMQQKYPPLQYAGREEFPNRARAALATELPPEAAVPETSGSSPTSDLSLAPGLEK